MKTLSEAMKKAAAGKKSGGGQNTAASRLAQSYKKLLERGLRHSTAVRRGAVQRVKKTGSERDLFAEPRRYLRGVEAAKLFELPEAKRGFAAEPVEEEPTYLNPISDYVVKHRRAITALSIVLLASYLMTSAAFGLKNLFTSKTTFIEDEQQAGNITITDRLVTTTEMSEKVSYFLLVGLDDSAMLTDCLWVMCYDIAANKANVMQIPRDTYVGDESASCKINAVYQNTKKVKYCEKCQRNLEDDEVEDGVHLECGTEYTKVRESNISATIRAINEHFGLPIDHFVIFNFRGFARIVDTMGGVDVTLPKRIHDKTITLEAGDHHLDGWDTVNYMRHRKSYAEGDVARVSAQRLVVNALVQKAIDMDVTTMLSVLTKCLGQFQTDLSIQEITDFALQARSLNVDELDMFTMPGWDHWHRPDPSYYICDEEETALLINEKMLPYGLPDGGYASIDTVNFPILRDGTSSVSRHSTWNYEDEMTTVALTEPTEAIELLDFEDDEYSEQMTNSSETESSRSALNVKKKTAESSRETTTTTTAAPTTKTTTTATTTTTTTTTTKKKTTTTTTPTTTTTKATTTKTTTAAPDDFDEGEMVAPTAPPDA